MRKYELTEETTTIVRNGAEITLHRIQAVRDFWCIKAGERGGYVESEANLSQEGYCWISGNAKVYGSAEVYGSAKVYGSAEVSGSSKVCGDTVLSV